MTIRLLEAWVNTNYNTERRTWIDRLNPGGRWARYKNATKAYWNCITNIMKPTDYCHLLIMHLQTNTNLSHRNSQMHALVWKDSEPMLAERNFLRHLLIGYKRAMFQDMYGYLDKLMNERTTGKMYFSQINYIFLEVSSWYPIMMLIACVVTSSALTNVSRTEQSSLDISWALPLNDWYIVEKLFIYGWGPCLQRLRLIIYQCADPLGRLEAVLGLMETEHRLVLTALSLSKYNAATHMSLPNNTILQTWHTYD